MSRPGCALLALLLTTTLVLGCTQDLQILQQPTSDHPIVRCIAEEKEAILFSGADASGRTILRWTANVRTMGISAGGKLAAVCTSGNKPEEVRLTVYDPSMKIISAASLDLRQIGVSFVGDVWVSDRGEVIFVASSQSEPRRVVGIHIDKTGMVEPFSLSGRVRDILFTDAPGFAVLQWTKMDPHGPLNTWRLSRFASPSKPTWEAEIVCPGYAYFPGSDSTHMLMATEFPGARKNIPLKVGVDIQVCLDRGGLDPGHGLRPIQPSCLYFRPDGTYTYEAPGHNPDEVKPEDMPRVTLIAPPK
jgi:hypothetical protein